MREPTGVYFCKCGSAFLTDEKLLDHVGWRNANDGHTPGRHALDYFRLDAALQPADLPATALRELRAAVEDYDRLPRTIEPVNEMNEWPDWVARDDVLELIDAALAAHPTPAEEPIGPGPEVPPLPWTSPALLQPWPDSAANPREVRDATGASVFVRNWREAASALRYIVRLVNREHAAAVAGALAVAPDLETAETGGERP